MRYRQEPPPRRLSPKHALSCSVSTAKQNLAVSPAAKPGDLPRRLPNHAPTSQGTLRMHAIVVGTLYALTGRGYALLGWWFFFLNKSLIPSSGHIFKHKCCCESSRCCSDVLWLSALEALAVQQRGSKAVGRNRIGLSAQLSAGCKAKRGDALSRQTPILIQNKKQPYTVMEVLTLPRDRDSRMGEGRSSH